MKKFKDYYKNKQRSKLRKKRSVSLDSVSAISHNLIKQRNYVDQPPVGNPPNVGYTQEFGS
jgi:hypothetical protein